MCRPFVALVRGAACHCSYEQQGQQLSSSVIGRMTRIPKGTNVPACRRKLLRFVGWSFTEYMCFKQDSFVGPGDELPLGHQLDIKVIVPSQVSTLPWPSSSSANQV